MRPGNPGQRFGIAAIKYEELKKTNHFADFAFCRGWTSYGFLSRKNWAGLDMGFVTVNRPPVTTGGLVTSTQLAGGVRLGVDCSVNPVAFVGQERIMELVLGQSVPAARDARLGSFSFPISEVLPKV